MLRPLILILLTLAAGCGKPAQPEVVVYVAVDRGDAETILNEFERQTGITTRALYDAEVAKTTGLVTRLLAEADRQRCDVFWNNELAQSLLLTRRGVLQPYRSPAADDLPDDARAAEGHWTAVASRARVIVYNTRHLSAEEVPKSLVELSDPRWRGKVAMANPQFGTTRAHVAAIWAVWGPERTQQWLTSLMDNDLRIVDGNAMVMNRVALAEPGASAVYIGLTDTDDVLSGQADGKPVGMIFPDQDDLGTLFVPSSVALIAGAPHAAEGKRLIDYLVGGAAETALATGRAGYLPMRATAPRPSFADRDIRSMEVSNQQLLDALEPSSRWTKQHVQ
jgi:iron(III) transport system substrate-binding protein